jgi:hypothetical protein
MSWTKILKSSAVWQFFRVFAAMFAWDPMTWWLSSVMLAERHGPASLSTPASDDGAVATSQSAGETNSTKPVASNLSVSEGGTPDSAPRASVAAEWTSPANNRPVQQTRFSNGAEAELAHAAVANLASESSSHSRQSQLQGNNTAGDDNSLDSSPSGDERRLGRLFTQEAQIYHSLYGWGVFSGAENGNLNP